jgi:hypothetical protein
MYLPHENLGIHKGNQVISSVSGSKHDKKGAHRSSFDERYPQVKYSVLEHQSLIGLHAHSFKQPIISRTPCILGWNFYNLWVLGTE